MEQKLSKLLARLSLDERFSALREDRVKFIIDGSSWIFVPGTPARLQQGAGAAACCMRMSSLTFIEVTEHGANPQSMFLRGEIKVSGNTDIALRWSELMLASSIACASTSAAR